jgi:hypothetical protein
MKNVIVIDQNEKKFKLVKFSGKHNDIYDLVGKGVTTLDDVVVSHPSRGKFHTLFDRNQIKGITPNKIVIGGLPIEGNVVICTMTDDMSEFKDVTESDMEHFKNVFEFN